MSRRILLVGAGQLGSRYLQGIAAYDVPLNIYVLDCSLFSLDRAASRWDAVPKMASHRVSYIKSLSNINPHFDLVINSTTANGRHHLIGELVSSLNVSAWILEKVLAQDIRAINFLEEKLIDERVWVNTPRHSWSIYKKLRAEFCDEPIKIMVEGLQGLACNGIHFIDLLARWNGSSIVNINTSALLDKWHQSKRLGFYDVFGEVKIIFDNGSILYLSSREGYDDLKITVSSNSQQWIISQNETIAVSSDGKSIGGEVELQSTQTKSLLQSIFDMGRCDLPTLSQSVAQHRPFLGALLEHWRISGMHGDTLLIT